MRAFRSKIYYCGIISLLILCLFIRRKVSADVCGNTKSNEAYKKGIISLREKLYNKARKQFEKAIRYDENCVEAHFQLGLSYTFLIPYQDLAIVEFQRVLELVPDNNSSIHIKAVFNEGLAYLRMGAYKESIVALRKVKELDPTYKDLDQLYNYLGVAYCFLNDYEQAIREFRNAIQENATYREANYNLKSVNARLLQYNVGVTYGFMGNYTAAIENLNKAIEISTNYYNAHLELARIYIRTGMYGDAINELIRCERINPDHRNARKVLMNLGIAYYNQGSPRIAVEYLRKAIKLRPGYEKAIKNLRSILQGYDPLKEDKTDPIEDKDKYIETRMVVARDYYVVGMFNKAVKVSNEVLNIDFQNKEAADLILASYSARADYYINKKDYSKAIKALKRLLKITPENAEIWFKLGISYYSMPGNYWYKEADGALRKVIKLGGEEEYIAKSYYYMAEMYYAKKKYEEASEEIDMAIRNNPDNPEYYLIAAKIFRALRMLEEAEGAIKMSIELDSENDEAQKLLRAIMKDILKDQRGLRGGVDDFEEFDDVVVEDYKTLIRRGLSYIKREEYDNAERVFRNASESTPEGMEAHNNTGGCLLHLEKFNEALVEFMVSDSMAPKDASIHINLAITYYLLEDYKNAKSEYLMAVKIDSGLAKDQLLRKLLSEGVTPSKDFLSKIRWRNPQ